MILPCIWWKGSEEDVDHSSAEPHARPHSASIVEGSHGLRLCPPLLPCDPTCALVGPCPQKTDAYASNRSIPYGRCPECLDFSSETFEEFETVVPPFGAVFQVHRAV